MIKLLLSNVKLRMTQSRISQRKIINSMLSRLKADYFTYNDLASFLKRKNLYSKKFINEILNNEYLIAEVGDSFYTSV